MWFWQKWFSKKHDCCCHGRCSSQKKAVLFLSSEDRAKLQQIDEKIVVGKILSIKPHPDASMTKVRVCEVSLGEDVKTILCGGVNVAEGQFVPIATVGAKLSETFEIAVREIKGVSSFGMICSRGELGLSLGDEKKGEIWVFPFQKDSLLGTFVRDL